MEKNIIGHNIKNIITSVSCNRKRIISIIKEIDAIMNNKGIMTLFLFLLFDFIINILINRNVDKNIENIERINNIG